MPHLPPIPTEGPPTLGIVGDDGIITAKRRTRGYCPSHALVISEDERSVRCKKCEKMFDAIEALLYLASWPDRWRDEVTHLNQQIKAKTAVLDELTKRLKNDKATARRRGVPIPNEWEALRSVSAPADTGKTEGG
jgi:hypothetical protein